MSNTSARPNDYPAYANRTSQVLDAERELYLRARRRAVGLSDADCKDDLTGLCISGGGVRSATLGLGLLQALVRAGKLKYVDYLSTVSGGGYIGSCLSSLLSAEPPNIDKGGQIPNRNQRFRPEMTGVEADESPFVGLHQSYEYKPLGETQFSVKHQIHHLRRHGEYLTPNKKFFGWDVYRAIGGLAGGALVNLLLFLLLLATVVALHHALFDAISAGKFMPTLREPAATVNPGWLAEQEATGVAHPWAFLPWDSTFTREKLDSMSAGQQFSAWARHKVQAQVELLRQSTFAQWRLPVAFLALGILLGWAFIFYAQRFPLSIARSEQDEQRVGATDDAGRPLGQLYERAGGEDLFRHLAKPFFVRFYVAVFFLGPLLAYGLAMAWQQTGWWGGSFHYFVMLVLPVFFSLGLWISVQLLISLWYINHTPEQVTGRLYRSFYSGMQGAALVGLFVSLLFPAAIVLLFGDHGLAVKLSVSFVPVLAAYYVTARSFGGSGAGSMLNTLISKIQMPLLNLSILLFVGLSLAWVSNLMIGLEQNFRHIAHVEWWLFGIFAALLAIAGLAANSNDISLHYFYRDRLSEAYLRTDGRVGRLQEVETPAGVAVQPKELFDVNLRNHEDLRLQNLGDGNGKGPYHLIVGALNLQGSNDLAKKAIKSDHFIFSKYYIGSRTTGYAASDRYRGGSTKLSTAMTISAAAMASGMGQLSFAASSFYMTLFNLRTGYWIENPWWFYKENREAELEAGGRKVRRTRFERLQRRFKKYPFWLYYLWQEFTGDLGANTARVYVSDGGHTGDNLGLLPLVQRRCANLIIADFEEDARFSFASFNQAVRLAKAIYDADVHIDLTPLMPVKDDRGAVYSPASVATGEIVYADGLRGKITYMKSSVSLLQEMTALERGNTPPLPPTERAPVYVLNYFRTNPAFPHQSTADQYFDEVQFEAYRMLGEYIGTRAVAQINFDV